MGFFNLMGTKIDKSEQWLLQINNLKECVLYRLEGDKAVDFVVGHIEDILHPLLEATGKRVVRKPYPYLCCGIFTRQQIESWQDVVDALNRKHKTTRELFEKARADDYVAWDSGKKCWVLTPEGAEYDAKYNAQGNEKKGD